MLTRESVRRDNAHGSVIHYGTVLPRCQSQHLTAHQPAPASLALRKVLDGIGPLGLALHAALSQITENRKVETCKWLIFRDPIFGFCLQKPTLRQSPIACSTAVHFRSEARPRCVFILARSFCWNCSSSRMFTLLPCPCVALVHWARKSHASHAVAGN